MRRLVITVISLVLLLDGLQSVGVPAEVLSDLPVQPAWTERGIPYLNGGIGTEERDALRHMEREYDVKLIFALSAGNYLSDVSVTIVDAQGRQVLAALSDGPWFYTYLPAGTYTVIAQARGQTRQRVVQVHPPRQTQLQFYWGVEGPRTAGRLHEGSGT
jgi:hypothetical protein